jgi:small multidrug resistance pump
MTSPYLYLGIAILAEVMGTSFLKGSQGFTRLWPSLGTGIGYAISFYFLSLTLNSIPTGIAYSLWSGVGIVLISLVGWRVFHQELDGPALTGIALIVAGVLVINLFSKTAGH